MSKARHDSPRGVPPALPVVLGSGSAYRRELLSRLLARFDVVVPAVDEAAVPGEPAPALARRLANLKAATVAAVRPDAIVIGSDQVAECAGRILGKPGSADRAREQLRLCSGHELRLHTAACMIAPGGSPPPQAHLDLTVLRFRRLSDEQIRAYVDRDQPLDCAGSFRFEALGAALFESVQTQDPTAIQGLPLLWLATALERAGVGIL